MNFNFKPFDLSHDEYAKDKLTTPSSTVSATRKVARPEDLNTLEVETYRRIATPIAVIILTMIGAVIASRKVRGAAAHTSPSVL